MYASLLPISSAGPRNNESFEKEVLKGFKLPRKTISCKFLYDEEGSKLFEAICDLEEYYPLRTEMTILSQCVSQISGMVGPGCRLVEFGSGASVKTEILLEHLLEPAAYVPVEISPTALIQSVHRLIRHSPALEILPVCADFTSEISLPKPRKSKPKRTVAFFPGSTIGNFGRKEAEAFLARVAQLCGPGGGFLIGVDLKKDRVVLEAAYNDSKGVTADFNLNLLARINRELGGNFNPERFRHEAVYDEEAGRIEMRLISLEEQHVAVSGETFLFRRGECIVTEYSHKYTIEDFEQMAHRAGFLFSRVWTDPENFFAVFYLSNPSG